MTTLQSSTIAAGGCVLTCPGDPANPTNASTAMVGGKVQFENDNYRIVMDDDNTVHIFNKNTGEDYRVWGDPHVDIDGQHAFDFWGTTTFSLDDGTKVTIETTPWAGNADATVSSKVTITNGGYGVQVTGVDSNTRGDLKFEEAEGWGGLLDAVVKDGNTLHENGLGAGFLALDGQGRLRKVDQALINETDLKKGGALQQRFADHFQKLGGLMSIMFVGAFLSGLRHGLGGGDGDRRDGRIDNDLFSRTRVHVRDFGDGDGHFTLVISHRSHLSGWYRALAV